MPTSAGIALYKLNQGLGSMGLDDPGFRESGEKGGVETST